MASFLGGVMSGVSIFEIFFSFFSCCKDIY